MTLKSTATPSIEITAKTVVQNILQDITDQDRQLYSRQEVEDMLLDIYCLLGFSDK